MIKSTCPYCGTGCGVLLSPTPEGLAVKGDPAHPANFGRLCSKGSALGEPVGARGRLLIRPQHLAPNGRLHAASLIALADTMTGHATMSHLPEGAVSFATIELKSNHLGTLTEGELHCVATAQHLGRTTQVWDAVVSDAASGRQLVLYRCTQMVLWPAGN